MLGFSQTAKISSAEQIKVRAMLVIGNRDMEKGEASLRVRGEGNLGAKPRDDVIAEIVFTIAKRGGQEIAAC